MIGRKITTSLLRAPRASLSLTHTLTHSLSTFTLPSYRLPHTPSLTHSSRFFSSESSTTDSNLSQILTEEILEETSRRDEEVDEDYEDVKKYITSLFTVSERVGYGEVILTRSYQDETITIKFDCQDEADDGEGASEGASEGQDELDQMANEPQRHELTEDDADQLDGKFGIHFEATIAKKNGDKAVFSCIATHQQPSIVHVSFVSGSEGVSEGDDTVYGGPRYDDLDPAVQGGFQQYLAERGVDDDLSFFIIQHSRYKEESEYLHWLKTLNEFVN